MVTLRSIPETHNWSVVAADKFVHATRDSGYSSTASAIAELVDNAIQADATKIRVSVEPTATSGDIEVQVEDNGCGMELFTLRQALRFGGSSRFNDRSGLGRFGMGLPNSSLSQARLVTVTTWTSKPPSKTRKQGSTRTYRTLQSYLDVDEIASGTMVEVPRPRRLPAPPVSKASRSGTLVHWTSCDRLDFKRPSTICRHLTRELAQRFRCFLNDGIDIQINGQTVKPVDPMFLMVGPTAQRAQPYGDEIAYTVLTDPSDSASATGTVRVRFAELPVAEWANLSNSEKRERGIVNNAGASILRADREVDYGWFFFGAKRKENYDDWWRCEIKFDPVLDEAFGITHSKQQIRPKQYLIDILTPDMEKTARALNARARTAHAKVGKASGQKTSQTVAATNAQYLTPLRASKDQGSTAGKLGFHIREARLPNDCFYSFELHRGDLTLTLDPDHAFYRDLYAPLCTDAMVDAKHVRHLIELVLFSAARAEAAVKPSQSPSIESFRATWSKTIQTLVRG